jgi:uncharacterized membrane protein
VDQGELVQLVADRSKTSVPQRARAPGQRATLLADNCLSCHASRERPVLSSQLAVQANQAAILNAAVTSSAMPQDGSRAIEERKLLGEWLACGAP